MLCPQNIPSLVPDDFFGKRYGFFGRLCPIGLAREKSPFDICGFRPECRCKRAQVA
jgi:hypothetical protein